MIFVRLEIYDSLMLGKKHEQFEKPAARNLQPTYVLERCCLIAKVIDLQVSAHIPAPLAAVALYRPLKLSIDAAPKVTTTAEAIKRSAIT